jgi:hypothetical protein
LRGRKLTYALVFFVAVLVILSGTLYYYNSGKKALPLQGPFISITATGLTPSGRVSIDNFSAYVYLTTTNSSSKMNDALLFKGTSFHDGLAGYLNKSFYSITGAWNSQLQSSIDNISLSLYAFYDNVSGNTLHVFSFYNNLPYNPAVHEPQSFNEQVVFNLSIPELVIQVPKNTVNHSYTELIQFINSSTVQNSSILLGSYLSNVISPLISQKFYPTNPTDKNSMALMSFRGMSYINGSSYVQESVNDSFSGGSFNLSNMPESVSPGSELNLGPVDLHVSNFYLRSGYVESHSFTAVATNFQTTLKILMANSTLKVNETNVESSSYLRYFDEFIAKYTANVTKTLIQGNVSNDRNWTYVSNSLNLSIKNLLNKSGNLTVLYINLGLSLLDSDFNSYQRNTSLSLGAMLSEQIGNNLQYLVEFNGMDPVKTNGTYYEDNLIINEGPSSFNASYQFSTTNVSVIISSNSYYGSLPITTVLFSS